MNKVTLTVPKMSCGHCKGKIEKALNEANIDGSVILDNKTVEVNESNKEAAVKVIEEAGYSVER